MLGSLGELGWGRMTITVREVAINIPEWHPGLMEDYAKDPFKFLAIGQRRSFKPEPPRYAPTHEHRQWQYQLGFIGAHRYSFYEWLDPESPFYPERNIFSIAPRFRMYLDEVSLEFPSLPPISELQAFLDVLAYYLAEESARSPKDCELKDFEVTQLQFDVPENLGPIVYGTLLRSRGFFEGYGIIRGPRTGPLSVVGAPDIPDELK